MIKNINYCYINRTIASFYFNNGGCQIHLTGYVEKFNEQELLIAHISSRGEYDGFILKHIDEITRIDYEGEYEKKIEKLYAIKKQNHKKILFYDKENDEILYSLLDFSKENDFIITVEFKDSYLSGLVNGYDNNIVYISIINDYGVEMGISTIDIDEAVTISVDTDSEQDLKLLKNNGINISN